MRVSNNRHVVVVQRLLLREEHLVVSADRSASRVGVQHQEVGVRILEQKSLLVSREGTLCGLAVRPVQLRGVGWKRLRPGQLEAVVAATVQALLQSVNVVGHSGQRRVQHQICLAVSHVEHRLWLGVSASRSQSLFFSGAGLVAG